MTESAIPRAPFFFVYYIADPSWVGCLRALALYEARMLNPARMAGLCMHKTDGDSFKFELFPSEISIAE